MLTEILCGDNLPILQEMLDNSVDAIVTDPPYGLSFMGKRWDYDVPSVELWAECLRVLKPGGHLLAFAGTRTQHRMAVRIEDAGFEIRDMLAWVYGSGFPKSLDVSKAIDKAAGAEREVVGQRPNAVPSYRNSNKGQNGFTNDGRNAANWDDYKSRETQPITTPATNAAKQWDGWGTALKPALEPITLARKPLAERTVAANVLEWGTGGVNVDGCRVGADEMPRTKSTGVLASENRAMSGANYVRETTGTVTGRFPANLIHDGSDEVVGLFPVQPSGKNDGKMVSAARFFYCAKASRSEREAGCEGLEIKYNVGTMSGDADGSLLTGSGNPRDTSARNHHPTVKPIALMRYLCRLVTPPGGIVLDPFTGSGTTGCAATLAGFGFIGIEREAEYAEIARRRIEHWRDVASQDETIIEDVQEKLFAEMV